MTHPPHPTPTHLTSSRLQVIFDNEFHYKYPNVDKETEAKLKRNKVTKFNLLITTYEVVIKDIATISKLPWRAVIIDEAHRLKNPQSKFFKEVHQVPRDFSLLLTGTPLQNSSEELWSLLHFADMRNFPSKDLFVEKFGDLKSAKAVSELH